MRLSTVTFGLISLIFFMQVISDPEVHSRPIRTRDAPSRTTGTPASGVNVKFVLGVEPAVPPQIS